jgi:hypothetical protein
MVRRCARHYGLPDLHHSAVSFATGRDHVSDESRRDLPFSPVLNKFEPPGLQRVEIVRSVTALGAPFSACAEVSIPSHLTTEAAP